jgi:hypothetical protein
MRKKKIKRARLSVLEITKYVVNKAKKRREKQGEAQNGEKSIVI